MPREAGVRARTADGQPVVTCPFCERLAAGDCVVRGEGAAAIRDAYPVSPGHSLVIPVRHVTDFFDLDPDEQSAVWRVVAEMIHRLAAEYSPDGFNVGLNVGEAAGQTVAHAHVHVIPRFAGDVPDPRGGVRRVIPHLADWWSRP
jgi:diadenosine tetraphosphate (Ap4A) HIT family hydrolase